MLSATPVLRYSARDGIFVALSLLHGAALVAAPSIPLIAIGFWWNANSIAHNFIHLPFFRSSAENRLYSIYLSLLLGVPQSLWRARHLMHHAGLEGAVRWTRAMTVEATSIAALWTTMVALAPQVFAAVYLPGLAIGLGLCWLQGHYEHAHGTTSHYGRLYNTLFFNDGYHVEHHLRPGEHWTRLGAERHPGARRSRWPPVLRWLDAFSLEGLERLVLRSPRLQRFVLAVHERAFRRLLPRVGPVRAATVVGGGLFPRSALVLGRLYPDAAITIIDASAANIEAAQRFVGDAVAFVHETWDAARLEGADLIVVPLSLVGDRRAVYDRPPSCAVLVHDWIWARRGPGVVVSWMLLKRLNLVERPA